LLIYWNLHQNISNKRLKIKIYKKVNEEISLISKYLKQSDNSTASDIVGVFFSNKNNSLNY